MRKFHLIYSKVFFGTISYNEAKKIQKFLSNSGIKCELDIVSGEEAITYYKNDPFHVYSKTYISKLPEFYIIRVHRSQYEKAVELYNDY